MCVKAVKRVLGSRWLPKLFRHTSSHIFKDPTRIKLRSTAIPQPSSEARHPYETIGPGPGLALAVGSWVFGVK